MAVAEWGGMARAAKHLAISQPVVSKVIADLEEMLGVRLLDRSPQGVEPTLYAGRLSPMSANPHFCRLLRASPHMRRGKEYARGGILALDGDLEPLRQRPIGRVIAENQRRIQSTTWSRCVRRSLSPIACRRQCDRAARHQVVLGYPIIGGQSVEISGICNPSR
jgi:Bacterial regulatory helix-turn-helix protein, lysR family